MKGSNIRVLVVGTSRKTRGGITAVIKAYEKTLMWKKYHCRWIGTHRDSNIVVRLWYFWTALVKFVFVAPFYDIIHVHLSLPGTAQRKQFFMPIAKLYRKKTIVHLHCGTQIDGMWSRMYDRIFSLADRVIVLSNNLKPVVESHIGKTDKIQVVYNPCVTDSVQVDEAQRKKEILFAGTLYEGKGYRDFIRAFALIAGKCLDWNIVLAGNGEVNLGASIAQECGIADRVKFLGWVSGEEKDRAYREASIFCLPSYAEGFPMAVLDAFSYGLPVITTPVGGIPDVAVDDENMLLFEPGGVDALASKMERLITDAALRAKLSEASIEFARTTFNLNTITMQLSGIYDELMRME